MELRRGSAPEMPLWEPCVYGVAGAVHGMRREKAQG